jgi:hypothetical protein
MLEPLPLDQLANPHVVLEILGSFWAHTYAGRDQVLALAGAAGDAAGQAQLDLFELVGCLARRTVPIHHRERWHVLYLRRSLREAGRPAFGATGDFGAGLSYGAIIDPGPLSWPCSLAAVATIFNRIAAPSRSLTCGVDFVVRDGWITFRDDPFADPLLAARDIVDESGTIVDREIALWCFAADSDREFIYQHFGYILGLRLPSSVAYRELINAILDAFVGGTAIDQLLAALAAIAGIPVVRETEETVAWTARDGHGRVIVTDRHAYRFPIEANPVVMPGDVVHAGDRLVDTVEVHELNDGRVPPGLTALATGEGLLASGYYADLIWPDREVPVRVRTGPGQLARVSWELGGYPPDVERFWDEVHARGLARGQTLAHLLDRREVPATEPGPEHLPATINPLEFLIANLLRGNAVLVRVRAGALGPDALGVEHLRLLRRIMPPHACLITLIELPPQDDSVKMAGILEELTAFDVGPPLAEFVPRFRLGDGPSGVSNVAEGCLP